ncbi:DNA/RNA non-specific endonuclease [Mucilaginibacter ginsenosidivorans]|uniref:DNA/RNA non-specific endonuclease n=1 Tax=Mucilaginibacter ginsenosidivorans TaxID=398053 RepID=A0A5B8UU83_9SPHI|nr:DNA/RNA non-specific endonuclease [Mucilaginibacter ginsenosidivorans]QEC62482.1 hypothetical protein FRZ54_07740 [Mucilaginibacter ginsenosidivorans]
MIKRLITISLCSWMSTAVAQDTVTIVHHRYITTFDTVLHYPVKVHWILNAADVCPAGKPRHVNRTNDFRPDAALPGPTDLQPFYHAIVKNYDRGHNMDAADNACSTADMHECFYFSNMTAQARHLNEITWERLEVHTRAMATRFGTVEVWCGSYGKKKQSGPMTIPSRCWKIIRYHHTIEAYIFPNTSTVSKKKYTQYKSTVSQIRAGSHLALTEITD